MLTALILLVSIQAAPGEATATQILPCLEREAVALEPSGEPADTVATAVLYACKDPALLFFRSMNEDVASPAADIWRDGWRQMVIERVTRRRAQAAVSRPRGQR